MKTDHREGPYDGLAAVDLRDVGRRLVGYRTPSNARAAVELATTVVPFVGLWLLMWLSLELHYLVTLALAVPTAGFLLRLFLIQHDCGHGAFAPSRAVNDWIGRCIGVVTLTPYDLWRRGHAVHHAGTGNLDRRGLGDVDTITVEEYRRLSPSARLRYRLYRNPAVMFGIGPAWLFFLRYRLPLGEMHGGWRPWASSMGTNAGIVALWTGIMSLVGVQAFLIIQVPITLIAATIGVWLFYVQHQFEDTVWTDKNGWAFHQAAVAGSSHYVLPAPLRWITANIGLHHVHHLCSGIPYYRLSAALAAAPELDQVNRVTVRQSLGVLKLALWDEKSRRLVPFRHLHGD